MALVGSGRLSTGQTEMFDVVLAGNVTHTIYVRPDRSGVDFDLRIYDENGNLVQWDETFAADALCQITPRWTGAFRIFVLCASGASGYRIMID